MNDLFSFMNPPDNSSTLDWILWVLILIVACLVVGLLVWILLITINYTFLPIKNGVGIITSKEFIPNHRSSYIIYNSALKNTQPVITNHPDTWKFVIKVKGSEGEYYMLDESKYNTYAVGMDIPVSYESGRLWGSVSIQSIN